MKNIILVAGYIIFLISGVVFIYIDYLKAQDFTKEQIQKRKKANEVFSEFFYALSHPPYYLITLAITPLIQMIYKSKDDEETK